MRRDQQDSQQFWLAVLSAIRQASGTTGEGEQLAATPDFNEAAISERVLSELAAHHARTFLVIDDLHELTSAEALMQLTRLLEKLPPHVHAILATRRDLPLRLHKLRLAGELADIRAADLRFTDQVRFLASPVTGQSDDDIALDSDLRAVALMNLGIAEAWSLGNQDSERHLQEGADLARRIGRPYLEVACLAELAFASKIEPFATARRRCQEAIALAEQHGWGAEPVISPALVNLAGALIWTGEFDEGDYWLQRTGRALETDTGPPMRLLLHIGTGMLLSGRRRQREALAEYSAAELLQAQLEGSHALAHQLTGWRLATQARLGQLSEARAALAALDAEPAGSAEICNARAAICLAEGNPAAALAAVQDALAGIAPAIGYVTVR